MQGMRGFIGIWGYKREYLVKIGFFGGKDVLGGADSTKIFWAVFINI
jgi:hypothetical protein